MKKKLISLLLCLVLVMSLGVTALAADIAITTQPQDQTAAENEMVQFSVSASGTGLSYRWQYCPAGSTTWTNAGVTGCKTDTITVVANAYRDGQSYRCVITDADGETATSDPAVLTLDNAAALAIKKQPQDVTASAGDTITMHVQCVGSGLSYQWQYCAPEGEWANSGLSGRLSDTLTIPVTNGRSGQSYRCIIKDKNGNSVISDAAVLTVSGIASIKITHQPSDISGAVGDTVILSVAAEGNGLSYQWQYCNPGKTVWNDSGLVGRQTNALTIPVTEYRDGISYRCIVKDKDGNSEISDTAKLTVSEDSVIKIDTQPQDVSAEIGETVQISVKAIGNNLSYQWQYSEPKSETWNNCGLTGRLTDTLTIPVTAGRNGMSYHCVITDSSGNMKVSDAAVLTAKEAEPPAEESFTVTFTDYDGSVLATEQVESGKSAKLPEDPEKSGADFLGWSGNYSNVTKDETVRAVYSDEKNVFVIQSASGAQGDTITVLLSIDGKVKTCGFDINVFYDPDLTLVSYDDDLDLDIVVNDAAYENGMKLNFSAASDKTKQRDIIELTFKINETSKDSLPITVTVNSVKEIVSNNPADTTYVVTNGAVAITG